MPTALSFPSLPSFSSRTAIVNALSSLRKRVSDFVFSKWGVALVLLSVAVGVRFGKGPGAGIGVLGLALGLVVQWTRSAPASKPVQARADLRANDDRAALPSHVAWRLRQIEDETDETRKTDIVQRMNDYDIGSLLGTASLHNTESLVKLICATRANLPIEALVQALIEASNKGHGTIVDELLKKIPEGSTLETIDGAVHQAKTSELGLRILRFFLSKRRNAIPQDRRVIESLSAYASTHGDGDLVGKLALMLPNRAPAPTPPSHL